MAEDWGAVAADIAAALSDVGHTGTLIRSGGLGGDEWNPTPLPDVEHTVQLLGKTLSLMAVDGTAVQLDDRREMMAAGGIVPTNGDRLRIGDDTYTIVRAMPYAPGGVDLYYDLVLRG